MPTTLEKKRGFRAFLATLCLGAFNDNVSKMLVICYGTSMLGAESTQASTFLALAAACFILPYLLFPNFTGFLADRFSKKSVMIYTKMAEIVIMFIGFLLAMKGALYSLLAVLFFMGAQSAFFSPAKYGFLPETHSSKELPRANGATQLWTFIAIIFGGWIGGALAGWCGTSKLPSGFVFCIVIAILGAAASLYITPTNNFNKNLPFRLNDPFTPHYYTFKEIYKDSILFNAFIGNTLFWFLGTIAQLVLVLLVEISIGGGKQLVGFLQAALGLGIGTGCALAGHLGKGWIPYHLVLPGGICMALSLMLMALTGCWAITAIFFAVLAGFFGGFFQLPLSTTIQERSPEACRGRYLAAGNALDSISMMAGSSMLWILRALNVGPRGILAVMGVILLAALPYLNKRIPK